jgi:hypothetical protein
VLSEEAMAKLPAALRTKLRATVVTLDAKLISQAIDEVAEHDAVLASVLARCAQELAYSRILDAIDAAEPSTSAATT